MRHDLNTQSPPPPPWPEPASGAWETPVDVDEQTGAARLIRWLGAIGVLLMAAGFVALVVETWTAVRGG